MTWDSSVLYHLVEFVTGWRDFRTGPSTLPREVMNDRLMMTPDNQAR